VASLLQKFYKLLIVLSALSMVAAFVVIMLTIISREMGFNVRGLDSYAGFSIAAALFLAMPETLRKGEHIRVTLLLQKVPAPVRSLLEYFSLATALALACYLSYFSVRLVMGSYEFHDVSQGADATPLWIPQLTMAIGCIGLAVAFTDALVSRIIGREFFPAADGEMARTE
jgi:TRAP-type C4-dicarboxylate transport system permease small subunit